MNFDALSPFKQNKNIISLFNIVSLLLLSLRFQSSQEYLPLEKIKKNGFMLSKNSCNIGYTSKWNKENIKGELRTWFQSIQVQKQHQAFLESNVNDVYVKLSKNSVTNGVIVTSVGKLIPKNNRSDEKFQGWTKFLFTSDDQFHDGFYYGIMDNVNGEISGRFENTF